MSALSSFTHFFFIKIIHSVSQTFPVAGLYELDKLVHGPALNSLPSLRFIFHPIKREHYIKGLIDIILYRWKHIFNSCVIGVFSLYTSLAKTKKLPAGKGRRG